MNTNGPAILGLPTCRDMKLVTLNCSLTTTSTDAKKDLLCQYKDCFEGIGCFKGEFHITLDTTVLPVIHPPRRVPKALREPLKKELETLVQQGIITKVDELTNWVNWWSALPRVTEHSDCALTSKTSIVQSNGHTTALQPWKTSYHS